MAGLSFCDLDDANVFYTKLTTREITTTKKKATSSSNKKKKGNFKKK